MDNKLQLWIDVVDNKLLSGWNSTVERNALSFKQGDILDLDIHIIRRGIYTNGGVEELSFSDDSVLKVAVGNINQNPTEGKWSISYGSDTIIVDNCIKDYELNELMNNMSSISTIGGVTVYQKDDLSFSVTFNNDGEKDLFILDSKNLTPTSTAFVQRVKIGEIGVNEVQNFKLKCTPIAFTDSFIDGGQPVVSRLIINSNITNFSIEPSPKDGYFKITDGNNITSAISVYSDALTVYNAIKDCGIEGGGITYSVKKVGLFSWNITQLTGSLKNLTTTSDIQKFNSKVCTLNLNTAELELALNGQMSSKFTFEIELSSNGKKSTLYQTTVIINNDLIDNAVYSPLILPTSVTQADFDSLNARVNAIEILNIPYEVINPMNNQVLSFDYANQKWVNREPAIDFTILDGGIY